MRFYLPLATLLETGNLIAKVRDGQERRLASQKFVSWVTRAFQNEDDVWNIATLAVPFQDRLEVLRLFQQQYVMNGIGWGDMLIVEDAKILRRVQQARKPLETKTCIWTLDETLRIYSPDQCAERCIWPGMTPC